MRIILSFEMKRIYWRNIVLAALAACMASAFAQDETPPPVHRKHKKVVTSSSAVAAPRPRQVRAILAPTGFPISLSAFDRASNNSEATGTMLEIARNATKSLKPETLFTKDLDGEQITSMVSWHDDERSHFGFLVLTTPARGSLYNVMFFLYHGGRLTMPIDEIATGYPVIPTVRKSDKTGQIQIQFVDGNEVDTNDETQTAVIYTWSDKSKKFLRTVHEVASASVSRPKPKARRVEKTQAASDAEGG